MMVDVGIGQAILHYLLQQIVIGTIAVGEDIALAFQYHQQLPDVLVVLVQRVHDSGHAFAPPVGFRWVSCNMQATHPMSTRPAPGTLIQVKSY